MQLFVFQSATEGLYAFAGDAQGGKLPSQFQPWVPRGVVETGQAPPHNFSRAKIEAAIGQVGFQLWKAKTLAAAER